MAYTRLDCGLIALSALLLTVSPGRNNAFAPDDIEPLIDGVTPRLQAGLTSLSTSSKQIVANRAGHNIHSDEPQLELVDHVRANGN